jgi:hypothetical protein
MEMEGKKGKHWKLGTKRNGLRIIMLSSILCVLREQLEMQNTSCSVVTLTDGGGEWRWGCNKLSQAFVEV